MELARRLSPRLAWAALLAMLAMALLPALSHAMTRAVGGDVAWVEVCTAQGMRLVALPSGPAAPGGLAAETPAPDPLQAAAHLEHCAWCTLAPDQAPPPALPADGLRWPTHGLPWPAVTVSPPEAPEHHLPLPRGPPACG
jgi:hypothetical protein